jgi:TPR repeat protein
MFVFAVESYKTSFQISSKHSIEYVIESQGKGISISPKSYEALFNYSLLCLKGKVGKHGVSDAKIMLHALIKRGFIEAYPHLGWQSYLDEDYKRAYKYLTHKKTPQNVFTYHKLGFLYLEGKACAVDKEAAINNFEKSAELDDVDSMFQLGKLYHAAEEEFQDDKLAQMYLHKAVSMGNVGAVMYLDEHYLKIRETFLDVTENILATLTKDGEQAKKVPYRAPVKQKNNELCSCGSGEKYKRCHGARR